VKPAYRHQISGTNACLGLTPIPEGHRLNCHMVGKGMCVGCFFYVQYKTSNGNLNRTCSGMWQEDVSESRPIHTTFREAVQQMAAASEEYQREGIHFLRALLNPDPAKRLTAEEAFDHPFLTGAFDSVAPDSLPPETEEPILIDNTLTRAVRKACRKLWKKKDDGESEGSENKTDEEEESDEEEERKEGEESEEESEDELKV
jgi:serine/threonine protein kinase